MPHHQGAGGQPVSRSVTIDYEALRERQARAQECLAPDLERSDDYEQDDHQ
jgi:hypothetical protein